MQSSAMGWIRKRAAWIAGAAAAGMILWLISSAVSLQSTRPGTAGLIFGRPVTVEDFMMAAKAVTHHAILRYGERYRSQLKPEMLETQAWERLTLLAEAKKERIKVSNQEVIEEIGRYPIFQAESGQFDQAAYQAIMRYSLGTTARVFEEETRDSLKIRKLIQKAVGESTVSDLELKTSYRNQERAIRISFFTVPEEAQAQEAFKILSENPDQLDQVAKELDQKVVASDLFKRTSVIEELGVAGGTLQPLFGLEPGTVAAPIQSKEEWIVARLEEKVEASEEGFEPAKDALRENLLNQKKIRAYLAWYQDLIKRADLRKVVEKDKSAPEAAPASAE